VSERVPHDTGALDIVDVQARADRVLADPL
jgi:hypothetical protein